MAKLIIKPNKHILELINDDGQIRYFDLKLKKLYKLKKGEIKYMQHDYMFFSNISIDDIECEEERFIKLLEVVRKLNCSCRSISTFLTRISDYHHYEPYIQYGLRVEASSYRGGYGNTYTHSIKRQITEYSKNTLNLLKDLDIMITCDFEVTYFVYKKFTDLLFEKLKDLEIEDSQKKNFIENCFNDYRLRNLKRLVEDYKYNFGSLIKYLVGYLEPFENLHPDESIGILTDYMDMAYKIGREVDKYPKYLKSMHDILVSNYNAFKQTYDEILFQKQMKIDLEFESKEFSCVIPKSSKDIIDEGVSLNHCVSSYVDKVLKGQTYIFFLRKSENKDKSLITLEFKEGCIVQAKGQYNRAMTDEEKLFLEQYCKKKEIVLKV